MGITGSLMAGSQIVIGPQSAKNASQEPHQHVMNVLGEGQKPPAT